MSGGTWCSADFEAWCAALPVVGAALHEVGYPNKVHAHIGVLLFTAPRPPADVVAKAMQVAGLPPRP